VVGLALWVLDSEHTNPTQRDILQFAGTNLFEKAREHIFGELKRQGLDAVYREIELPLVPIIAEMKELGLSEYGNERLYS